MPAAPAAVQDFRGGMIRNTMRWRCFHGRRLVLRGERIRSVESDPIPGGFMICTATYSNGAATGIGAVTRTHRLTTALWNRRWVRIEYTGVVDPLFRPGNTTHDAAGQPIVTVVDRQADILMLGSDWRKIRKG